MILPPPIPKEKERIETLRAYHILDTVAERDFDELTKLAGEICKVPIALITLIDSDRQWLKSKYGFDVNEIPREYAFCTHAFNESDDFMMVEDATIDMRFMDNPLVIDEPYVIFYAGVVLRGENGFPLGTLCVVDHIPRKLNNEQIRFLKALARQVMYLFELKRSRNSQLELQQELENRNKELSRFAYVAAHDLKSPLLNISALITHFEHDYGHQIDASGQQMIKFIYDSSERLKGLIEGLLQFSKHDDLTITEKTEIKLDTLCNDLLEVLGIKNEINFNLVSDLKTIRVNPTVMDQILINLITNSIKYSDKEEIEIEIGVFENPTHYTFYFKDNGPGISPKHHEQIFNIFEVKILKDKYGKRGTGIGLATVKKIVEKCGGEIRVESELGKGARFIFTLEK